MSQSDIHAQAHQCWHFRKPPPLVEWLSQSHTKEDRERLCAIGNIVIPRCARLAMHVIGRAAPRI